MRPANRCRDGLSEPRDRCSHAFLIMKKPVTLLWVASLVIISVAAAHAFPFHHRQTLVWQENFNDTATSQPDPAVWDYEHGKGRWGNNEIEDYCAFNSSESPCDPEKPNAFVSRGYLHIAARRTPDGSYTSARMLSKGLKTFQYGRIEARIKIAAGQGIWPAFWMLGEDSDTTHWPACGELDVMEVIGKQPDTVHGSAHGQGFRGPGLTAAYAFPDHRPLAAGFHRYGMLWSPGKVQFYIDHPRHPYAMYTPSDMPKGGVWPFDSRPFYLLINVAVGGDWPGNPNASTVFPAEMLFDSLKVWKLQ